MAMSIDTSRGDDIKTQFVTREGTYKLMTLSDCTRQNRIPFNGQMNNPVKVSFIRLIDPKDSTADDKICFNLAKELYVYQYRGVKKALDLSKPLDKRAYRGTSPTCHDFNQASASNDGVMLIVGFSAGQVQLIDPVTKELSRLYNEERLTDKTKVTCIRWVPGSPHQFVVSHSSGHLYVYNKDLPCSVVPPHYQPLKHGDGFTVHTCKTKRACNPVYRWTIGDGSINEFTFSPCSKYLAVVSQDGFLRIFTFETMELVGNMKSYFGGLLCVCWSPDGKYVVTGGEDDLVTVWSMAEARVVCRGKGHRSWVSVVAFDPFVTSNEADVLDFCGSDDDFCRDAAPSNQNVQPDATQASSRLNGVQDSEKNLRGLTYYRFGSVGHDTMLCLWDLTDEILSQTMVRPRGNTIISQKDVHISSSTTATRCNNVSCLQSTSNSTTNDVLHLVDGNVNTLLSHVNYPTASSGVQQKFATLAIGEQKESKEHKEHRWHFSLASRSSDSKIQLLKANLVKPADESVHLLGTPACPRLSDAPLLEPLICKKIAHERLTAIVFREDSVVMACQEGIIYTWARPGKYAAMQQTTHSSPQSSINSTAL